MTRILRYFGVLLFALCFGANCVAQNSDATAAALISSLRIKSPQQMASCDVFDPFHFLPENSKYQIGGAFPLHDADCVRVNPSSVYELVGIQWALSRWKQRAAQQTHRHQRTDEAMSDEKTNERRTFTDDDDKPIMPTIGLFAGDSCRRAKESVSQTLRFLDAVGFHEPRECAHRKTNAGGSAKNRAKLLGVLAPSDVESAYALAGVLKSTPRLPVGVFGESAAEELHSAGAQNVISTAPILADYITAFLHFMRRLDSNLVAIVDGGESDVKSAARTTKVADALRRNGIYVSEVIGYDHELLSPILRESDARIILSLVSRSRLSKSSKIDDALLKSRKIWVNAELDEENERNNDNDNVVDVFGAISQKLTPAQIGIQLVIFRRQTRHLPAFSDYFYRVLTNYTSFTLLSGFVEQRFNCSIKQRSNNNNNNGVDAATEWRGGARKNCDEIIADTNAVKEALSAVPRSVLSALRLAYAFALIAERIENAPEKRELCENPLTTTKCYDAIVESALALNYDFGAMDPSDLHGTETLRFRRATNDDAENEAELNGARKNFLIDAGIHFEFLYVERHGRDGISLYKLSECGVDNDSRDFPLPSRLRALRSACPTYRAYCGQCERVRNFENDEIFLSNPRQYSLYLAGIFDFHTGPNCEILRGGENIALPLAFSHTLASSLRPKSQPRAAQLDIGALLVDGCSSDRRAMEYLVESENGCYRFAQADRNWTIIGGSTFGYISTSASSLVSVGGSSAGVYASPSVAERFFTSQNSPAPVLTLTRATSAHETVRKSSSALQPQEPPATSQQNQLGTIFSAMPSHRSTAAVLLKYLRRMRWDLVNVVLDETDADSVVAHGEFERAVTRSGVICIADTLAFNANNGAPSRVFDASSSAAISANVTVIFAGARSAADYLSTRLRRATNLAANGAQTHVHVLVGEAHDFYLHDAANVAHYAGAVSVQPKDVVEPAFREWLASVTPLTLPEMWFWRYVEERWKCALSLRNIGLYQNRMCSGDELLNVAQMGRMTKAGYLAKSTRILISIAEKVYRKLCADELADNEEERGEGGQMRICDAFLSKGRLQIRNLLAQVQLEDEFEVLEFQPVDHHGNFGYSLIANYSTRSGFYLLNKYKTYLNTVPITDVQTVSHCSTSSCPCTKLAKLRVSSFAAAAAKKQLGNDPTVVATNDDEESPEAVAALKSAAYMSRRKPDEFLLFDAESVEPLSAYDEWRSDSLRYVLLALTTVFCVVALAIFALIVVKLYFRIVKGNQSLGILLLIGVFLLYASAYGFIISPMDMICNGRVVAHAVAHTLCFGVLMVKALQLRNAEALAYGGTTAYVYQHGAISYLNYWLLLLFIMSVQAILWLRWLTSAYTPSTVVYSVYDEETEAAAATVEARHCSQSTPDFFLAESYALLLLFLALLLNALNRNIKRNYKEAKWLFMASLSCTVVFVSWIVSQIVLLPAYTDYATIVELYATGTVLLAFVFGPKIYVLLSYEPIIVECKATGYNNNNAGGGKSSTKQHSNNGSNNKQAYGGKEFYGHNGNGKHYDLFESDWPVSDSRTISPATSTRATSPVVNFDPTAATTTTPTSTLTTVAPSPRPRNHNKRMSDPYSNSDEEPTKQQQRPPRLSTTKKQQQRPAIVSQLTPSTLSTALSSTSGGSDGGSTSDSETLSSVLQTVLRKKTPQPMTPTTSASNTVRRAASQNTRNHLQDSPPNAYRSAYPAAYSSYQLPYGAYHNHPPHYDSYDASNGSGPAFVVLPHVAPPPPFHSSAAAAVLASASDVSEKKKRKSRSNSQKSARI